MHELSITRNVVALVAERARGRKVTRVTLAIGRLSGIEAEAVRLCFPMVAAATPVEGAELVIDQVAGRGSCTACERELELDAPVATCPCERRERVKIVAGEELLVRSMEVSGV